MSRFPRNQRTLAVLGWVCLVLATEARAQLPFTPARILPASNQGLAVILSGDVLDRHGVEPAVRAKGFYAGEPIGTSDCAGCHSEIARQFAGSAHRFASFNNPYYAASVEHFRRQRSPSASRFCGACHDPLLLFTDTLSQVELPRETPAAQAGLPCLICHSIKDVHGTIGNGHYLLVADPVPQPGIKEGRSLHKDRLRPPFLGDPRFCGGCHKVGLTEEITRDIWLRGQNDYDAWHQSMAAGHGVASVYRRENLEVKRCQDCHMPLLPGKGGKLYRSHSFLAANAALPWLREDHGMVQATADFLKGSVSVDMVVVREGQEPTLDEVVGLSSSKAENKVMLDVVLRNRKVGHRFPGGTNDSNDVYLEMEVIKKGKILRDRTHLVRAQPVDGMGHPLLRRDPQNMRAVVYDTSLSPADPQVVRYQLTVPKGVEVTVKASLRYRKFTKDYAAFACAALPKGVAPAIRQRCEDQPVLDVASATRVLQPGRVPAQVAKNEVSSNGPAWERYLDHGLGLADGLVERVGEAEPSLLRARSLAPERPEPLLGLARMYLAQGRMEDVQAAGAQVDLLRKDHPAALWLRALAFHRTYRFVDARPYLERLGQLLPADRNVLALLSRVRGLHGEPALALRAADALLQIDQESEEGHYQRMLALRELGRAREAEEAELYYLRHRKRVERDQELRGLFRSQNPALMDEETPAHTHILHLP